MNELQKIVKSSVHIRVVGAGHSFSAVVKTNDVLLNLDPLKGGALDEAKIQCTMQHAGSHMLV